MTDIDPNFAPGMLKDRVVFITGGGTGIGRGIVEVLGRLGAKIFITSRRAEVIEAAVGELNDLGIEAACTVSDVRDPEAVERAIAECVEWFGGLDILINNAAGNFNCPTAELSPNGWKTVIDIDLNGTFYCCRYAYPHLKESRFGGRIVSITTGRAQTGWPRAAHAGAAKAGILSLTRALAVEWATDGILVNTVAPGPIAGTVGVDKLYIAEGREQEILSQTALGRFGVPADIGNAIAYLCSPGANYVTGTEIAVDGGRQWKFVSTS